MLKGLPCTLSQNLLSKKDKACRRVVCGKDVVPHGMSRHHPAIRDFFAATQPFIFEDFRKGCGENLCKGFPHKHTYV